MPLEIPVVFIIFNRPDLTRRVWERIRAAQPHYLYIVADAPRLNKPLDVDLVEKTREVVAHVDWPCQVIRDYAIENEGDFYRTKMALDLAFQAHDRLIYLEDDCLPDLSFFSFCESMLNRYAGHETIAYINGSNLNWGLSPVSSDYYTSRYMLPWGYGLWKSSWDLCKSDLSYWTNPITRSIVLEQFPDHSLEHSLSPFNAIRERIFWSQLFDDFYEKYESPQATLRKTALDYYLKLALWANKKIAITPRVNLVENIGFGSAATHTDVVNKSHKIPAKYLDINDLKHPVSLDLDEAYEDWTYRVYALYEEGRPFYRWLNATRLKLGRMRRQYLHF